LDPIRGGIEGSAGKRRGGIGVTNEYLELLLRRQRMPLVDAETVLVDGAPDVFLDHRTHAVMSMQARRSVRQTFENRVKQTGAADLGACNRRRLSHGRQQGRNPQDRLPEQAHEGTSNGQIFPKELYSFRARLTGARLLAGISNSQAGSMRRASLDE